MNQDIYTVLGLKKKDLSTLATNTFKMVWEQILLLAIEARQQYFDQDADNFHQRMKMVNLLVREYNSAQSSNLSLDKNYKEIIHPIFMMLEKECGSTEIIKYLLDDPDQESRIKSRKKILLEKMEEKKIAFPTRSYNINYKRYYSYYTLYQILVHPIYFFQQLLYIPIFTDEWIEVTVINTIKEYICSKPRFMQQDTFPEFKKWGIEDIKNNLHLIQNDKDENLKIIKGKIADSIGKYIQKTFGQLSSPFYGENNVQKGRLLEDICSISSHKDKIELMIDKDLLKIVIDLNQIDELSDKIGVELKKVLNPNHHYPSHRFGFDAKKTMEQSEALEKISDWYKVSHTELFNRIDQIPKIIASILEFDIRYSKGFLDYDFVGQYRITWEQDFYKSLPANQIYTLVTTFIRNFLYYQDNREYIYGYLGNSLNNCVLDEMKSRDFSEIGTYPNDMMKDWISFENPDERKNMFDRFKRLSPYLNIKKPKYIRSQIQKQKDIGQQSDAPVYPLNSFFPLPLWVNPFHQRKNDQDKQEE